MRNKLNNFARRQFIPLRFYLWGMLFTFLIAASGQLYLRGMVNGSELVEDDCYGMSCTQYTLLIGQAGKESRSKPKQPPKQKIVSVWNAIE